MMPKPLPKPKPKIQERLSGKRKMTIAAGFLCRDGLVLCADTEETRGDMKFQVPKLAVYPDDEAACKRKTVFAGAGDSAFIDKLVEEMWSAGRYAQDGIEYMVEAMEDACIRVHKRYWEIYPSDARPEAHIIFGIVEGGETRLYKASGCIVNRVSGYELTGCGDSLARYITSRSVTGLPVLEAVSLSVYMLAETKKYVAGCGGASHIVALNPDGSHARVADDRITSITLTASSLQDQMWALLGPLTDHEMEDSMFDAILHGATEYLRGVRRADERWVRMIHAVAGVATYSNWNESEKENKSAVFKKRRIAGPKSPRKTD